MKDEDLQLDPETRALETELGSLTPLAPSDALADRIFASIESGATLDLGDDEPISRNARWWTNAALPFAAAAAVALFAVLSPTGANNDSKSNTAVAAIGATKPVTKNTAANTTSLAPGVMLTRASIDQELVDRRAEIVAAEDEGVIYRKVHTYQTERMRFYDKDRGVEVIAEVPCEEIRLEKVEAY